MVAALGGPACGASGQLSARGVYVGNFVHSKDLSTLEYLHDAVVVVDESGKIVAIEKLPLRGGEGYGVQDALDAAEELVMRLRPEWKGEYLLMSHSGKEGFFFPGFIDTHIHAPQYPNSGIFGKSTLLDWLEKYTFPLEASLSDLAKARQVYSACIRRTLSHGTTTCAYYATIDVAATNLLVDLCLKLGQRALIGRCCMDSSAPDYYRDESAEASLKATKETIEYVKSVDPGFELVTPIVTPRFAPSCSRELLTMLGKLAKEMELPVQTHISENVGELELVKKMFPEFRDYTDVYDKHGLLGEKTILAHGIWLSEEERSVIRERGAGVSHCPCSNSSITSGTAKVRWLLEGGVKVGLGTDVSGGYSASVLEAARQALLVSRHVAMPVGNYGLGEGEMGKWGKDRFLGDEKAKLSMEEVLYLATVGGAKVCGLEGKVGRFEVGLDWDAQFVTLAGSRQQDSPVDFFGWKSWDERIAKWLFGGDDRNTKAVWVRGVCVHARHDVSLHPEDQRISELGSGAPKEVWRRVGLGAESA